MQKQIEVCETEEPPSMLEALQEAEDEPPGNVTLLFPSSDPFESLSPTILPFPLHRQKSTASQSKSRQFRRKFFPGVSAREWNDWHWQVANRIRQTEKIERMLDLSIEEKEALHHPDTKLPVGVTPYYMSLVPADNPSHPMRRAVIPTIHELLKGPGEADDPLGEEGQSPIPGLVHRYPDRVLFLVHDFCSTYCRYCTRSRVVGHGAVRADRLRFERILDYIRKTPTIRDVLLSGGDPLLLSDDRLEWLLSRLRQIPHVEIIRIGTKVPAVLPQRITPRLVRMLKTISSAVDEPAFHAPGRVHRRRPAGPAPCWPMPASRSARRPFF